MKPILTTSLADINQQIDRCQHNIDLCEDIIKQLSGVTPDAFEFSFSIRDVVIVKFDIAESESLFTIGYFMSWLQYYRKNLAALKSML